MKYGIRNGKAGIDTIKPGILKVSVKKADNTIIVKANRLKRIYKKLEVLLNQPTFLIDIAIANVAKYVNATSVTEIKPNNCLKGKNQSGKFVVLLVV